MSAPPSPGQLPDTIRSGARFPLRDRPRLWGTAVSHYQVEGDDPCDWSAWEEQGRTRGGPCGGAVDSWNRYEDDAALAASVGCNAFRFSVSWSRVEPEPGRWNDAALERYARLVGRLLQLGLEPIVTLFHYTHPTWFHERSPWSSPASVERFRLFARRVAETLGRGVRIWIPLNEPLVFVLAGYIDAQVPPGVGDAKAAGSALDHLLAAHVAAANEIRAVNPNAAIGVAHNMMSFVADRRWHPLDALLSRAAHRFYNVSIVEAFSTGRWNVLLPPFARFSGRRDDLARSLDFFGVNFYSRLHIRSPGKLRAVGDYRYIDRTGRGLTDNGWEVVPEALEELLGVASRCGLPIVICENGLADAADALRARYIEDHLATIARASSRGIEVCGYLHWSLLDNFEWLDGFEPKFGLFEVDRATMERRPRPSAAAFARLGRDFLGSNSR